MKLTNWNIPEPSKKDGYVFHSYSMWNTAEDAVLSARRMKVDHIIPDDIEMIAEPFSWWRVKYVVYRKLYRDGRDNNPYRKIEASPPMDQGFRSLSDLELGD